MNIDQLAALVAGAQAWKTVDDRKVEVNAAEWDAAVKVAQAWLRQRPKPKPYYYQDEMFCHHCDKDTQHKIHDTDHDRDSSGDWRECLVCHWTKSGHGEYEPPSEETSE